VLGPEALADPSLLVRAAEKAWAPEDFDRLTLLGAALYRAGQGREALRRLGEASKAYSLAADQRRRQPIVYNWLFQAMAHHALGHEHKATEWLQKAVRWMDEVAEDKTLGPMPWNRRLTVRLLRREAEALLKGPPAGQRTPATKGKPHAEAPGR
jgi:hypothetical protein